MDTQRYAWARWLGLVIGGALLVAAVIVVVRQRDVVSHALAAMASPSPSMLAMLCGAVAANVVLSGVMFSLLMAPYGRVGRLEMQALLASTTLLNYLPLRPGLLGRIAYHKHVNNIAVTDSARVLVQSVVISIVVAAYAGAAAFVAIRLHAPLWGALLPGPVLAAVVAMASRPLRRWCLAGLVRFFEMLIWAARYYAAFALLDLPVAWQHALALAVVSVIATMVPFVSNGLGLREWAVGLLSPLLMSYQLSEGLTAELINRAAELVIVLVLGVVSLAYLTARRRRSSCDATADTS